MSSPPEKGAMQDFVAERALPGAGSLSEEEVRVITSRAQAANDDLAGEAKWLHSYFTDDKAYCVFQARSPEAIFRHGEAVGVPVDRVTAVRRLVSPEEDE